MTERYSIDAGISRFTIRAFATGMLSAFGHNPNIAVRDFAGEVGFSPDTPAENHLRLVIQSRSLTVTDNISDKDRRELERTMYLDVLEVDRSPQIVFESTSVSISKAGEGQYWANLVGNLSLHGVTQSVPVSAQVSLLGDTLRANGEFTVLQSAFDIKPVSFAGGALKLKDGLKCTFNIVARKQADNVRSQDVLSHSSQDH